MRTRTSYRQYVASEAWLQRRKLFLMSRPNCERCGISKEQALEAYDQSLHVHHRNYQRVGCELDSDLEALCRRCHEIETFGKSSLPPMHMSVEERRWYQQLIGEEVPQTLMTEHGLAGLFGGPLCD